MNCVFNKTNGFYSIYIVIERVYELSEAFMLIIYSIA